MSINTKIHIIFILLLVPLLLNSCNSKEQTIIPIGKIEISTFCEEVPVSASSEMPDRLEYMRNLFGEFDHKVSNEVIDSYIRERINGLSLEESIKLISEDYISLLSWSKHPDLKELLLSKDQEKVNFANGVFRTEGAMFGILLYEGLNPYLKKIK